MSVSTRTESSAETMAVAQALAKRAQTAARPLASVSSAQKNAVLRAGVLLK